MAPATKLMDLPDAILDQIALAVDSQGRRRLLPVLSKRWAGLLQVPGPAWAVVNIADEDFGDRGCPNATMLSAWFSRRAGSVRALHVTGYGIPLDPSLLISVLLSQAASLRELRLDCGAAQLSSEDLTVLVALRGLERLILTLKLPHWAAWNDHAADVIDTLSQLPALKTLELLGDWVTADWTKPTVCQLAMLQSPTLTRVEVAMTTAVSGTLSLGALPALVSCELGWRIRKRGSRLLLRVTPDSFSGATALTRLTLSPYDHLRLSPHCFSGLGMLSELSLTCCQLKAVPPALSGVQHTLRRLDLSFNKLRLRPHCLSGFSALEELVLTDCDLIEVPAALSGVQHTLRRLDLSYNEGLCLDRAGFDVLLALSALGSLKMKKMYTVLHKRGLMAHFLAEWQELHPGQPQPSLTYAAGF